ncbi:protein SCO1/2 [Dyadobacter jejuensis]|uniref:Protein SCO1/2 n=2 Tax=Dyadobacter jejuensis TaxID=1082580 RepID=A0A316AG27_9BACT|nr:protein SCO1/2 [Dyadobacter jejuensis]
MALALLSCSPSSQTESAPQALPYYHTADFTPLWLDAQDPALDTLHRIGEFRLVDQLGDTLTQANFRDKIYVTNFFFTTCPGICPKMTSSLSMVQDAFLNDDDILLLSHSVTPKTDSVPVLKAYGERKGIDAKKWHLVTGDQQEIYHLGRKVYFVEEDLGLQKSDDAFLHTENLVLIDKKQHIRGIYNGLNKASITQLIADIRTLQQEH